MPELLIGTCAFTASGWNGAFYPGPEGGGLRATLIPPDTRDYALRTNEIW